MERKIFPNSGSLFANDRKTEERHPDYTGTFTNADGVDHFFDAWVKTGKSGKQFLSVRVGNAKQTQAAPGAQAQAAAPAQFLAAPAVQAPAPAPAPAGAPLASDIPF